MEYALVLCDGSFAEGDTLLRFEYLLCLRYVVKHHSPLRLQSLEIVNSVGVDNSLSMREARGKALRSRPQHCRQVWVRVSLPLVLVSHVSHACSRHVPF